MRTATNNLRTEDEGYGAILAIDPLTGNRKWEYKMVDFTDAGVLTTASDVLFSGGREGFFYALDARTGGLLWKFTVGGEVAVRPDHVLGRWTAVCRRRGRRFALRIRSAAMNAA